MFGGVLFNNISYYLPQGLGKTKSSVYRNWSEVLNDVSIDPIDDIEWIYWKDVNPVGLKWRNVYVKKEDVKYINGPKEIYLSQVGVNADIVDDNHGVIISNDTFRSYSDTVWSPYSIVPI